MDRRRLTNIPPGSSSLTSTGAGRRANLRESISAYAGLFASLATLFCCALPALLVLVGFGLSGVLAFFSAVPGWQNFGAYTMWLFPIAGILLAAGFHFAFFANKPVEACEIPAGGRESACSTATLWNRRILCISLVLYLIALITDFWGIGWMRMHGYFNH